ncbi:MAG: hypothetical protein ACKVT2_13785 [Saprospiraceae bacterium]
MKESENWEDLLQKYDQKDKNSKLWLIAAIVIPLVLIGLFLYNNHKEKAAIKVQEDVVSNLRESLIDSLNSQEVLSDYLERRSIQYLDFLNKKVLDSLQTYYADTLDWYYVNLENASKSQIREAERIWFKKKPRAFAKLDSLEISFSNDEANAHLDIQYSLDSINFKPMFMVLKFNEKGQINFVKSYNYTSKSQ